MVERAPQKFHREAAWRDIVSMAIGTITGNRMRSLLLILGVAIGVSTLLGIYTIVSGLSHRIRDDVVSASRPYIYVTRFSGIGGDDPSVLLRRSQIMPECGIALEQTDGVELVDYQVNNNLGQVLRYRTEKTQFTQTFGCSENFPYLFSLQVGEGRFFTRGEVESSERVCVLGYGPANDLFPKSDPIGKTLDIFGQPYRIVGTMAERGHIIGSMGENYVCTPWTVYERDGLHIGDEDRSIACSLEPGADADVVTSNITGTMRRLRKLRPGEGDDFEVVASETFGELIDQVTGGIALVLVVLSSIGLLVGGIGVMNIMLISVAERTREIGLRMAVGARRQEVLVQVLIEAGVLTGIGGLIGIGFGYLVSYGVTMLLSFPLQISPWVTIGAALFSVAIGLFFGLYPANRAAKMDPVTALGQSQ